MFFPRENGTDKTGAFQDLSEEEFKMHDAKSRYGDFQLTDAIRPSLTLIPTEGYRIENHAYEDGSPTPVALISASREKLLPLFMDLLDAALHSQDESEVVLVERRSITTDAPTRVSYGNVTDLCIFKSIAYDYEDVLHDDGGMRIGINHEDDEGNEVCLDDDKTIIVWSNQDMADIENVLRAYQVPWKQTMKLIRDDVHIHRYTDDIRARCEELRMILGLSEESDEEELWL